MALVVALALTASIGACVLATEGSRAAGDGAAASDAGAPEDARAPDAGGVERCENGVDDDGDGLVDCADPDCAPGWECVDTPPEGWDGPLRIRDVAHGDPAAGCAGDDAPKGYGLGDAGGAACTPCSCGDLKGAACDPARVECDYGVEGCDGGTRDDLTAAAEKGPCLGNLGAQPGYSSCHVTAGPTVSAQGGCLPDGGAPIPSPPVPRRIDACATAAHEGGCGPGRACARKPSKGYAEAGVCVRHPGEVPTCPASFAADRRVVWQDVTDDRGCDACSCAPSGTTCTPGSYTLYPCAGCASDPKCAGFPGVPLLAGQCTTTTAFIVQDWSVAVTPPTPVPGACTPSGGAPTGSVRAENQVTFCCKP
jgi:hypothetical protein